MNYSFSQKVSGLKPSAIREILKHTSDPSVIPFAAGNPAPDAFPIEMIREISAKLIQENPILALQYNITEGYAPLIEYLKNDLKAKNCFNPDTDELIITSGAQQSVELSCKVLCDEGDAIISESPSFIGSLNSFRSYNVNLVGVEMENDGINIEKLEKALKETKNVRLIYVIPNFQNPTGRTMSLEKRKAVYELACRYNVIIIEDNPYGDLRFDGEDVPSIKEFDTQGRVIHVRSFSKVLAPGLRVGYCSAPKDIIQKIVVCKQVADVHTNIWAQAVCYEFLKSVNMDEHLGKLRNIYRHKYQLLADGIAKHFSSKIKCEPVQGGLFMWASLPSDCDVMGFCTRAVKEVGVAVVPGSAFAIHEGECTDSFRMNFSTPSDEQIIRGCELLGDFSKKLFS